MQCLRIALIFVIKLIILMNTRKKALHSKQKKVQEEELEVSEELFPENPPSHKKISISSQNLVICKVGSFDDDYVIAGKIGEGSFGTVYKVMHKTLKIHRALKTIKKRAATHFSSFEEIQILKKLDHSNILKIYEFYEAPQFYYIITEIFEGNELFDQISEQDKLSEEYASNIMQEILRAINYTHSLGIAHRDIKPENILIKKTEDQIKVKIIDWGLGILIGKDFSDRVCGTPDYCAPEVLKGSHSITCDLWSVGVIAYVMLTGEMPFSGNNTEETINSVKKGILNITSQEFKNLSTQAQKFITALVNKNPLKRMSASKALEHEWITKYTKKQVQPLYLKETLERLRQFKISNTFGVAVISFMNNHLSEDFEREKLQNIFKFLDKNGDGVLSMEELVDGYTKYYGKVLGKKVAEETFEKLDFNHNGTLEFSQFVAFGLKNQQEQEMTKMKEAFNLFDRDKNGKISLEEIHMVLKGKIDGAMEEEIKDIIKEIDQNNDQEIDFEEFLKCLSKIHKATDKKSEKQNKKEKP